MPQGSNSERRNDSARPLSDTMTLDIESGSVQVGESWGALRGKAKGLKAQLDSQMLELGTFAGRLCKPSSTDPLATVDVPSESEVMALRNDIEQRLLDLHDAKQALFRLAISGPQTAQATRFRESHQELSRDFRRLASNIDQQLQHRRLLPGRSKRKDAHDSEEAGLMCEKRALESTLSMTDEVLAEAQSNYDRLVSQRGMLGTVGNKIGILNGKLPTLNQLLSSIQDKKKREQLILAAVVAGCIVFTLWYKIADKPTI